MSRRTAAALLGPLFAAALLLSGCDGAPSESKTLTILSGSENESVAPIVAAFCKQEGWSCPIAYKGSIDIRLALESGDFAYDAVWPAHSRWIDLGDRARRVKHAESIFQSPVAFGVRQDVAAKLGLDSGRPVRTADILALVRDGQLRFMMTSASQSNSGFSAYIAMLTAFSGQEVVNDAALERQDVRASTRDLLQGVDRTAGSSGWLKDLYVRTARDQSHDAMVNYEVTLIEANRELTAKGLQPLRLIYPVDGVAIADSPLGFYPRDPAKEAFFQKLKAHLLSEPIQRQIAQSGRRTGLAGSFQAPPDVFRAEWGIDPGRVLSGIRFPPADTIDKALALYQEILRKPSLTALCLDFSGSMSGAGADALKAAITRLFDPAESRRLLIQAGSEDITIVIPFSGAPMTDRVMVARGADQLPALAARVAQLVPDGGTDIYACTRDAIARMTAALPRGKALEDYTAAVVTMTDGQSQGDPEGFYRFWQDGRKRIPVFAITFGDADRTQLDTLADTTRARVFDGTKDLGSAFRSARGYN